MQSPQEVHRSRNSRRLRTPGGGTASIRRRGGTDASASAAFATIGAAATAAPTVKIYAGQVVSALLPKLRSYQFCDRKQSPDAPCIPAADPAIGLRTFCIRGIDG